MSNSSRISAVTARMFRPVERIEGPSTGKAGQAEKAARGGSLTGNDVAAAQQVASRSNTIAATSASSLPRAPDSPEMVAHAIYSGLPTWMHEKYGPTLRSASLNSMRSAIGMNQFTTR